MSMKLMTFYIFQLGKQGIKSPFNVLVKLFLCIRDINPSSKTTETFSVIGFELCSTLLCLHVLNKNNNVYATIDFSNLSRGGGL